MKRNYSFAASLSKSQQIRFAIGTGSMGVGVSYFLLPFIANISILEFFPLLSVIFFVLGAIHIVLGLGLFYKSMYKKASLGIIILLFILVPVSMYISFNFINRLGTSYMPILGYIRILTYPFIIYLLFKHSNLSPRKGLHDPRFDHDI